MPKDIIVFQPQKLRIRPWSFGVAPYIFLPYIIHKANLTIKLEFNK